VKREGIGNIGLSFYPGALGGGLRGLGKMKT